MRDAARFRARSTSHTVAVRDGCTNIPLAAGGAQEDENLSRKRRFRPRPASVRPPGSVRTDHVPRITVLGDAEDGLSSGRPNHCAFDHDSSAHIFPERDQQVSRQRHDRCLAPTTAVTLWRASCRLSKRMRAVAGEATTTPGTCAFCRVVQYQSQRVRTGEHRRSLLRLRAYQTRRVL